MNQLLLLLALELVVREMEVKTVVSELLTRNIWSTDKPMRVKLKLLLCQRLVVVHLLL